MTDRPFSGLVTVTTVPSGSVLEAAVRAFGSKRSPLLVVRPSIPGPYHDAVRIFGRCELFWGIDRMAGTGGSDSVGGVAVEHAMIAAPTAGITASRVHRKVIRPPLIVTILLVPLDRSDIGLTTTSA